MKTTRVFYIIGVSYVFLLMSSCSLWGPLRVDEGAKDYQLKYQPKNWDKKTDWEEADYLFISKKSSAHITVQSLCNRYEIASLESLSKSALSPLKNREEIKSEKRMIDDREALTKRVKGTLDGVQVEIVYTVLRKADCMFDFFLTSYPQVNSGEEEEYEKLLKGFHYKGY